MRFVDPLGKIKKEIIKPRKEILKPINLINSGEYKKKQVCIIVCRTIEMGKTENDQYYKTKSWDLGIGIGFEKFSGVTGGKLEVGSETNLKLSASSGVIGVELNIDKGAFTGKPSANFSTALTEGGIDFENESYNLGYGISLKAGVSIGETNSTVLLNENKFYESWSGF